MKGGNIKMVEESPGFFVIRSRSGDNRFFPSSAFVERLEEIIEKPSYEEIWSFLLLLLKGNANSNTAQGEQREVGTDLSL